jgi:hypothetical protein
MFQIAPEPIQPPDDENVESAPSGIGNQAVESWAAVLRPAHAFVDVFHRDLVAGRAGSQRAGLTLNTYAHVLPALQSAAADKMDAILKR